MQGGVILGTKLGADGLTDLVHQGFIESCGHADSLRKYCGDSSAGYAVQPFVPPVVLRNLQARNGRSGVAELGNFFFKSHTRDQVVDALLDGELGIQIGRVRQRLLR